jgi:hypothetical protein
MELRIVRGYSGNGYYVEMIHRPENSSEVAKIKCVGFFTSTHEEDTKQLLKCIESLLPEITTRAK